MTLPERAALYRAAARVLTTPGASSDPIAGPLLVEAMRLSALADEDDPPAPSDPTEPEPIPTDTPPPPQPAEP